MANWTTWKPFVPSIIDRASQSEGVYELALEGRRWPYLLGHSSTIYYGMSRTGIRGRLATHLTGRGNGIVRELLGRGDLLKVRWWSTVQDPRAIECTLLDRFERSFGERPLGNAQGCAI